MQCPNGYTMSAHGVCQPTGNYNRGGLTPRLNPRRMGHGGGVHTGSPDSCQDGYGNNVPC